MGTYEVFQALENLQSQINSLQERLSRIEINLTIEEAAENE
jgi:regulator of replication initiation timing